MASKDEDSLGYRIYVVSKAKDVYEIVIDIGSDHSSVLSYCEAKRQNVKNLMEVRMI